MPKDKIREEELVQDSRFSQVHVDPRFRRVQKKEIKVKIDSRFKDLVKKNPDHFKSNVKIDKYGRPAKAEHEDVSKFFDFESDQEEPPEEEIQFEQAESSGVEDFGSSDAEGRFVYDQVLDKEDIPQGETTKRIALVNMDWDKISAADIYAIFHSTVTEGQVESVRIYKSEFGESRQAQEYVIGPQIIKTNPTADGTKAVIGDETQEIDEDERGKKNFSALRRYQLERLRYFYAIVTLQTHDAAKIAFKEIDGTEYENSGNFFDLRYVPDHEVLDETKVVDTAMYLGAEYKPIEFNTRALQHSRVKLTWEAPEEGDRIRTRAANGDDDDFFQINDDSESEQDVELIKRRRKLLLDQSESSSSDSSGPEGDMEMVFDTELETIAQDKLRERNERNKQENETTLEKYIRKRKEKKKLKQKPLEEQEKPKKKKRRQKKKKIKDSDDELDDFKVDLTDSRFKRILDDHDYALDPTNPQFKNTENMQQILAMKRARREEQ